VYTHAPALHVSVVQTLPSVQEFPSSAVKTQAPVSVLHASSVHALPSSQTVALEPTHWPVALHVSV
jgi:hypothetical protein